MKPQTSSCSLVRSWTWSAISAATAPAIKFYLHLSKEEQRKRFLERIDQPEKNWKFSAADIKERGFWKQYMAAYEACLAATSTSEAPWYVVPADDKENAQLIVSRIFSTRLAIWTWRILSRPTSGVPSYVQSERNLQNDASPSTFHNGDTRAGLIVSLASIAADALIEDNTEFSASRARHQAWS